MRASPLYIPWVLCAVIACGGPAEQTSPVDEPVDAEPIGTLEQPGLHSPSPPTGTPTITGDVSAAQPPAEVNEEVGSPSAPSCPAASFLATLAKSKLLIGGKMEDDTAAQAPFDIRYLYLAGGLFDSQTPCNSCNSCTAKSASCANGGPGCLWWGCWQDSDLPPGEYLRRFLAKTAAAGQLPMVSYYQHLPNSGLSEQTQLQALTDVPKLTRYFNDFRFMLKTVGSARMLLHVEPDLWGFAQDRAGTASALPVSVKAANPTDCASQPDTFEGFGRCLVSMARKYSPNVKVGLHVSSWSAGPDVTLNNDPQMDLARVSADVSRFVLDSGGGEADFLVFEMSDSDAGWYETQGKNKWLDPTNATLPNFTQMLQFARRVTTATGKPALFWQIPLGNMSQPNTVSHWKDNRVQYFFDHPAELAAAGFFGVVFGSGVPNQTEPETDSGYFVSRSKSYFAAGGQSACQ